jgi:hypothetical protein
MTLIVDGTSGVTFNDSSLQGAAASPYVLKNRIINGDMRIDQRNAGASVTPTNGQYVLDRWINYQSVASKYSIQQNAGSVTPPVGFSNYAGITSLSSYTVGAADYFTFEQTLEGFNVADLGWGTANAKTVILSFWVRSSLTGTFGGVLYASTGTLSYPFSYSISAANTWTQISVTITGPTTGTFATNNTASFTLCFGIGIGSTYSGTAGSWQASVLRSVTGATSVVGTNGATWYVTGVQLEIGSSATPFERRLYNQELANCQRYFEISGATGATGNPNYHGTLYDPTSTLYLGQVQFQVTKRTAPTITSGAGSTGTVGVIGISSFYFTRSAAAAYLTYWTASAEL